MDLLRKWFGWMKVKAEHYEENLFCWSSQNYHITILVIYKNFLIIFFSVQQWTKYCAINVRSLCWSYLNLCIKCCAWDMVVIVMVSSRKCCRRLHGSRFCACICKCIYCDLSWVLTIEIKSCIMWFVGQWSFVYGHYKISIFIVIDKASDDWTTHRLTVSVEQCLVIILKQNNSKYAAIVYFLFCFLFIVNSEGTEQRMLSNGLSIVPCVCLFFFSSFKKRNLSNGSNKWICKRK